ncbi:hypothetical protein ACVW0I_000351 [Bradyrhizobium sp. LM6.11]
MSRKVVLTCAITGGGAAAVAKHPHLPKTPSQIAASALDAAKAGAAIVHIHVREEDGTPSNRLELYEQVVKKLRESSTDVIINLTCGMDGTIALDSLDPPRLGKATVLKSPRDRVLQAITFKPEIATLDCGVLAFGESIYVARMSDLREMTELMQDAGVKPEIECFELGHIENAKKLIAEGTLKGPPPPPPHPPLSVPILPRHRLRRPCGADRHPGNERDPACRRYLGRIRLRSGRDAHGRANRETRRAYPRRIGRQYLPAAWGAGIQCRTRRQRRRDH